jgi:TolB-like protein
MTSVADRSGPSVCRFGDYELDRRTLALRRAGRKAKLAPQLARVLGLLVSRPGELVTRDEIRRALWGEATYVDFERNLNYCLTCIRTALGDTVKCPRYIETLPRRGYRFIASVQRQRPFAEPTLAVLPFANLNGDPAMEYFTDGITDALITDLARITAVRVISRQSVLHLKGSSRKLDEIARDLSVDAVVEGSALHEAERVRVTAQLILVEPERHAWAQSYECNRSDVLNTQREAARAIAGCVAAALRPPGAVAPASFPAPTLAPGIIEAFLKARAELQKGSAEGMGQALQHYREITAKAPDFAAGLAGLATCLSCLGWLGHAPTREVYPSAKQMALQAVAMVDSVSEARLDELASRLGPARRRQGIPARHRTESEQPGRAHVLRTVSKCHRPSFRVGRRGLVRVETQSGVAISEPSGRMGPSPRGRVRESGGAGEADHRALSGCDSASFRARMGGVE